MRKQLFAVLFLILSLNAFALTTKQAFRQFFNNPAIDSNKCGVNTQKFLQYLQSRGVSYSRGFVVSIHEDFAALNHFDARWGSKEKYQNGIPYRRSNWYFHVFAVIDGYAYDFSQTGPKVQPLKEYLETAYLPEYATENIFFQGVLTADKMLSKYKSLEMNIYELDNYRTNMGPKKYSGDFIELFNL